MKRWRQPDRGARRSRLGRAPDAHDFGVGFIARLFMHPFSGHFMGRGWTTADQGHRKIPAGGKRALGRNDSVRDRRKRRELRREWSFPGFE